MITTKKNELKNSQFPGYWKNAENQWIILILTVEHAKMNQKFQRTYSNCGKNRREYRNNDNGNKYFCF